MRSSTPWLEGTGVVSSRASREPGEPGNQFDFGDIGSFSFGNFSFGNIINFGNIVIQPTIALQVGVAVGGEASVTQALSQLNFSSIELPRDGYSSMASGLPRDGYSSIGSGLPRDGYIASALPRRA